MFHDSVSCSEKSEVPTAWTACEHCIGSCHEDQRDLNASTASGGTAHATLAGVAMSDRFNSHPQRFLSRIPWSVRPATNIDLYSRRLSARLQNRALQGIAYQLPALVGSSCISLPHTCRSPHAVNGTSSRKHAALKKVPLHSIAELTQSKTERQSRLLQINTAVWH